MDYTDIIPEMENIISQIRNVQRLLHKTYNPCECEWRKYEGSCLFETSCGNVSGMYRGFNFCPFCGKKIKIVE